MTSLPAAKGAPPLPPLGDAPFRGLIFAKGAVRMKHWVRFIGQRLVYMAITLFLITSLTFFLMNALPGTP